MSQELIALFDIPLHNVWAPISDRICFRTELLDMQSEMLVFVT